jgi:hypothetical protein
MAPPGDTIELEQARILFDHAIENIRQALDAVVERYNALVSTVKDHAWMLGPIPLYLIRNDLVDIRAAVERVLEVGRKVLRESTPVLSLFLTSIEWLTTVMTPVSQISYDSAVPADDDLAGWTGNAATAYRQKVAVQKAAIERSKEQAKFISQWLRCRLGCHCVGPFSAGPSRPSSDGRLAPGDYESGGRYPA